MDVIVVAKLRLEVQGVAVSDGSEKSEVSPPRIVSGPVDSKEHKMKVVRILFKHQYMDVWQFTYFQEYS